MPAPPPFAAAEVEGEGSLKTSRKKDDLLLQTEGEKTHLGVGGRASKRHFYGQHTGSLSVDSAPLAPGGVGGAPGDVGGAPGDVGGAHHRGNKNKIKPKKLFTLRSKVAPVNSDTSPDDSVFSSPDNLEQGQRPGTSSPLHPPTIMTAWGSSSSLDRYVGSLPSGLEVEDGRGKEEGRTDKEEGGRGKEDGGRGKEDGGRNNEESGRGKEEGGRGKEEKDPSTSVVPQETSKGVIEDTGTVANEDSKTEGDPLDMTVAEISSAVPIDATLSNHLSSLPSPQSNQSDDLYDEHSSPTHKEHVQSLRETSSATLVTVTPALRENRTSYARHGLSKLNLAEAGRNVFNFEGKYKNRMENASESDRFAMESDWSRNDRRWDIPEGSLKQVLPRFFKVGSSARERREVELLQASDVGDSGARAEETREGPLQPKKVEDKMEKDLLLQTRTLANGVDSDTLALATNKHEHRVLLVKGEVDLQGSTTDAKSKETGRHLSRNVGRRREAVKDQISDSKVEEAALQGLQNGESSRDGKLSQNGKLLLQNGELSQDREFSQDGELSPAQGVSLLTAVHSSGVKAVRSSRTARIEGDKRATLRTINLPPLRQVEHTDVYLGK